VEKHQTLPDASQQRLRASIRLDNVRSARTKSALDILLVALDVLMLCAAFMLGYVARYYLPFFGLTEAQPFITFLPTMILQVGTVLVVFYFSRLYHQRRTVSRFDYARDILGAVTIGLVLANGMEELLFKNTVLDVDYLRGMFFYSWGLSVVLVIMGREAHRILTASVRRRGIARDNLMIVGSGRIARDITMRIKGNPDLGYNVVGAVTDKVKPKGQMAGVPILGLYPDIPKLIDTYGVEQVIIALPDPAVRRLLSW